MSDFWAGMSPRRETPEAMLRTLEKLSKHGWYWTYGTGPTITPRCRIWRVVDPPCQIEEYQAEGDFVTAVSGAIEQLVDRYV